MYALFLCGPPGCGKSTYTKNFLPGDFPPLSTDELIFKEAERIGSSYNEIFASYIERAEEIFKEQVRQLQRYGVPYIIDRTNCTEKARKEHLKLVGSEYKKIAIYFPAYTEDVLKKRVATRAATGGHAIPDEVIDKMYAAYRLPQKTEGFDLVVSSSHFIDIMKVMKFND